MGDRELGSDLSWEPYSGFELERARHFLARAETSLLKFEPRLSFRLKIFDKHAQFMFFQIVDCLSLVTSIKSLAKVSTLFNALGINSLDFILCKLTF